LVSVRKALAKAALVRDNGLTFHVDTGSNKGVCFAILDETVAAPIVKRKAYGNVKFAHRSIMEYLFVARFRKFPSSTPRLEWTDQMKRFFWETSFDVWEKFQRPIEFQKEADLSGLEHLRLKPVIVLRSAPIVMAGQKEEELQSLSLENMTRVERAPHFYRVAELPVIRDRHVTHLSERCSG